jgi:archaellum biogenesis ATPase FlaH
VSDPKPPNNVDAERAFLGSILIAPEIFDDFTVIIKPENFYDIRHRYTWDAMLLLNEEGKHIDYITVSNTLKTKGWLKDVGGDAYLTRLIQDIPTSFHADSYAKIVREKAYKRQVVEYALKLAQNAYGDSPLIDIWQVMEDLVSNFSAYSGKTERLVFSAARLCSSDVGELTWVLKGWIMAGGINLIAGMPAAGKSFLVLDLAIGITSSGSAWNNQPITQGKVLYHFLDGSYRGMRSRVLNLCKGRGIQPPADLIFDFSPLNLKVTAEVLALRQRIKRMGVSVVIFDVMAKFIPGADENSVAEISPMMNTLREIANQTGTTFILIHHLNKGGNPNLSYRVRGSSDILGSVDTAIVVEYEHQNAANSMRIKTPQKVRESLPPQPLKFQIVSTDESISFQFADPDTAVKSKSLGQQEQIYLDLIDYLESEPDQEFLKQDLVQTLHLPENTRTVGRAFAQLLCDPKVQVQKRGSFKTYQWKKDRPDKPYP